jgi:hypothetical protein
MHTRTYIIRVYAHIHNMEKKKKKTQVHIICTCTHTCLHTRTGMQTCTHSVPSRSHFKAIDDASNLLQRCRHGLHLPLLRLQAFSFGRLKTFISGPFRADCLVNAVQAGLHLFARPVKTLQLLLNVVVVERINPLDTRFGRWLARG